MSTESFMRALGIVCAGIILVALALILASFAVWCVRVALS